MSEPMIRRVAVRLVMKLAAENGRLLARNRQLEQALTQARSEINTEIDENTRLDLINATLMIQLGAGERPDDGIQDE